MSVGRENDTITTLNIPAMTISWWLKTQRAAIRDAAALGLLLAGEPLFFRRSVSGLIWGYPEPLLAAAQRFAPALVRDDKFGLFLNQKTNSTDGVYTVFTGLTDPEKFAYIYEWNGMTHLPYWKRPCGRVNGTEGIMFPPIEDIDKPLYIFVSDLCRSAYLTYEGPRHVGAVPVYRYILPREELRNGWGDTACYCGDTCLQDGLIDVRNCHLDAPVVLSLPHFYLGNESLSRGVAGLDPNKMEHQIFLDVEPTTGVALAAARRTQINVIVSPVPHMRETEHIREVVLPIVWINESARVGPDFVQYFWNQVVVKERAGQGGMVAAVSVGGALVLITGALWYRRRRVNTPLVDATSL
ncbi:lysosome membrane protein 2-like [Branchiostoma floridae x Branchiostoma japonicum]